MFQLAPAAVSKCSNNCVLTSHGKMRHREVKKGTNATFCGTLEKSETGHS